MHLLRVIAAFLILGLAMAGLFWLGVVWAYRGVREYEEED